MLLPSSRAPTIVHARSRNADELDALLAIVPLTEAAASLRRLPRSARWAQLHARAPARAGTVHSTVLGNRSHTLAVLGYLKSDASAFERLTLAGRMLKEAAARNPQTVGLTGLGEAAFARTALQGLLAATLTRAFALPTFKAPERAEHHIRRVVLLDAQDYDTHYDAASARGTNLARWLTALPPNVLNAARLPRGHNARGARAPPGAALARRGGAAPRRRQRVPRRRGRQRCGRRRHRTPQVPPGWHAGHGARRRGADRQGHPLRHRRGQPEDAPLDARHAHRHGRQRGGAGNARRARRAARPDRSGRLACDHREPHRPLRLQAPGRGARR